MKKKRALRRLKKDLELRNLATHTQGIYLRNTREFLKYADIPIKKLNEETVRDFLSYLTEKRNLAARTVNTYSASIRFFFAVTLNRTMNYLQIPLMKTPNTLPTVIPREEIAQLINSCENLKHKAILLLGYGSGIRLSEISRLRTIDIKSDEMRIFISGGKRRKDRYTLLPQKTLDILRLYWKNYRPDNSEGWLFPGKVSQTHITASGVSYAVESALRKSAISSHITTHTLRSLFATHLLEDGIDIMRIKELLGHASIKSTAIYLRVANTTKDVTSPADKLVVDTEGGII
jgi:site-specific recombinase XerD